MSVPVVLPDEAIPLHYDLDMTVNLEACDFTCDMSVDYDVQRETDFRLLQGKFNSYKT